MSANSLDNTLNTAAADIDPILKMLGVFDAGVEAFNVNAALLKYGRRFEHVARRPAGLRQGPVGQCFKNCTSPLMQFLSDPHPPYLYAEGYALDTEMGVPFQHAWLVDAAGRAIDLTWSDPEDAVYFGVTFSQEFLLEAMRLTEVYGVLFNPGLEKRLFADQATFTQMLRRPSLPGLPRSAFT
uniref:hypothetical protein n=1 Tax=uncultured Rhizobium sp. TaxID=155567 RepID=UPI0026354B6A